MGMEATSLSRTLKTLEEKKLIERRANPNDGRSVLIYLTYSRYDLEKGLKIIFPRTNSSKSD